jgi:hypothetical protein
VLAGDVAGTDGFLLDAAEPCVLQPREDRLDHCQMAFMSSVASA